MHQNHIKLKEAQSTAKNMEKDYNNLRERLEQEKQKNSRIEQDVQNFQERELNLSKISTLQMKRAWIVGLSFSSFVRFLCPSIKDRGYSGFAQALKVLEYRGIS